MVTVVDPSVVEAAGSDPVDHWWRELGTAALLGTARRGVPPLPAGLGAPAAQTADGGTAGAAATPDAAAIPDAAVALLDAAALAGVLDRVGRRPGPVPVAEPAPAETAPTAGARAVQLLELVLTSPPGPVDQRGLVVHWLAHARAARVLVTPPLLPVVLALGARDRDLRPAVAAVVGRRGRWLAALNPDWRWLGRLEEAVPAPDPSAPADAAPADAVSVDAAPAGADWARTPTPARVALLGRLRRTDPARGRVLVESTWTTDGARDRADLLAALAVGIGPDDEPLLERALDDRGRAVRETAATLLDRLPGSARAGRMADRLRTLVHRAGLTGRRLEIGVPADPDPAGVRDGLGPPPPQRSARGWWLEQICAAAPLAVWRELARADPETTLERITDPDVLRGLARAARDQRDPDWAGALLDRDPGPGLLPGLLPVLPPERRERVVLGLLEPRVRDARSAGRAGGPSAAAPASRPVLESAFATLDEPWSAAFSRAVLARLHALPHPAATVTALRAPLSTALDPAALPAVEGWLSEAGLDRSLATTLRAVLQVHSLRRSISEAFR
ncbi:hypothetical protein FHX74_000612 [Friedmanniella endophytica]|uniref:Uncharacterized protein n=1 Tax=Microlunatus kandeliicorticis TaxID=1759536 RepID=A0A7W3P4K6_9ACTN|nr:DUF5691 domain-containing protein [Microlunatus kandeliicorticis]MBA8793018.1 hypothetical protein [Microlunatus kandeliicorticis]